MRVASFFAGIGGFDLGLERAGHSVVLQCEINEFCHLILKQHWPNVPLLSDILEIDNAAIIPSSLSEKGRIVANFVIFYAVRGSLSYKCCHMIRFGREVDGIAVRQPSCGRAEARLAHKRRYAGA